MRLRWRLCIFGFIVGSIGPLAVVLTTTEIPLFGYTLFPLRLFPLSLALLDSEFLPRVFAALLLSALSTINIMMYGSIGFISGWFVEKRKVWKCVRGRQGIIVDHLFGFAVFFGILFLMRVFAGKILGIEWL